MTIGSAMIKSDTYDTLLGASISHGLTKDDFGIGLNGHSAGIGSSGFFDDEVKHCPAIQQWVVCTP